MWRGTGIGEGVVLFLHFSSLSPGGSDVTFLDETHSIFGGLDVEYIGDFYFGQRIILSPSTSIHLLDPSFFRLMLRLTPLSHIKKRRCGNDGRYNLVIQLGELIVIQKENRPQDRYAGRLGYVVAITAKSFWVLLGGGGGHSQE